MKDPVDGTAQVVGSTQPPDSATSGNVNLTVVVQADGVEATSVEFSCIAPTKKWPFPGETLPVSVDRADPTRIRVRWGDVPEAGDVAKQQADSIAASLNQGAGQANPADASAMVEALQQAMPGAQINVDTGGMPSHPGAAGGDDKVTQLERLARLHESGALTDAEFEREKARVLGEG